MTTTADITRAREQTDAITTSVVPLLCFAAVQARRAALYESVRSRHGRQEVKYGIEYQELATHNPGWYSLKESYPSQEKAMHAISDLMARGGPWGQRAYRVGPLQVTALTHTELVRLAERLRNHGAVAALWFGEDGAEAVLSEEEEIAAAVPGGPVRRGLLFGRPIQEVVRELLAQDLQAAAQERERTAALEAQQRAAALERERVAKQERERAVALEAQQRAAALERERVAKQERERAVALEAQQRAAALEAQQRAAALERERVAKQERERAAALEAQQRAAQERERVAKQERERAVALEAQQRAAQERERVAKQERERAAALEAQQRAAQERERVAKQEGERAAALTHQGASSRVRFTWLGATQPPVAAVAPPVSVARVAHATKLGGDRDLGALAKLLRCGPWHEGIRASDLLTSDQLPAGARGALQELVWTATLTVRALGNALKRVQDKRIEGIPRKVTRTIDNHGFALWQVVNDPGETSTTSERPSNATLLRGALTGMGYGAAEAAYAVSALRARIDTDPLATLVREALAVLARRPVPGAKSK